MNLKKNLKHILETRGLTASALARMSSTPKQTLADWLAGASPKDLSAVKRVADALGVSVDSLCFDFADISKRSVIEQHMDEIHAGQFEVILRKIRR
jgi:transcriptional regulator with XRE-family HTH domain